MEQAPFNLSTDDEVKKGIKSVAKPLVASSSTTPMMAQFIEIKANNPGYLLFYRMGDFYELFFDDAIIASQALGITLTKRGKHNEIDIPMCGVPVRAHDVYLKKLISLGHKVAICEQLEDPAEAKKRGAKSVVKRDVVRLVSSGTITEDDLLPAFSNNFLCAIAMISHGGKRNEEQNFALAWADISTGETWVSEIEGQNIGDELAKINPAEILISNSLLKKLAKRAIFSAEILGNITELEPENFDSEKALAGLKILFNEFDAKSLSRAARSALGALVSYVSFSQKTDHIALREPNIETGESLMAIDSATRSSLELLQTNKGEAKGSLKNVIDKCSTAAGSRLLARRLASPLRDKSKILKRLDMVELFFNDMIFAENLRQDLRQLPDISRSLTRLKLDRGGPRDLLSLGRAVLGAFKLGQKILEKDDLGKTELDKNKLPDGIKEIAFALVDLPQVLAVKLLQAIEEDPPHLTKDGGFIKQGYDQELDELRNLAQKSRSVVAQLQQSLSEETKIKSLKIKYNRVLGYFVETPASHGDKLLQEPFKQTFIHRQSMANAMRFTTAELGELEGKIARAQAASIKIENDIFVDLKNKILANTNILRLGADALAKLDVTIALARLASQMGYCRPRIDNSLEFKIIAGRHPVVEQTLKSQNEIFVTNDCDLSGDEVGGQLWLLTGPNMGGKSTFLRQNALIAILAQMGSFVPADSAHIGIVDRVFSRVGASDDIASGRSTFMVEMVETAAILNRATKKSLVILDEIGRGTATFDGLSIAFATAEALSQINCSRALFATHFHEMRLLAKTMQRTSNHTLKVKEYKGEVVFLHEVELGAADRSYGISVAKLAGLPENVLIRAKEVLSMLEKSSYGNKGLVLDDLPLFTHNPKPIKKEKSPVFDMLEKLQPDDLSPRQAVEFLYELKKAYDDKSH